MSMQLEDIDAYTMPLDRTAKFRHSQFMDRPDDQKPAENVADTLNALWRRAGYATQDQFARSCGYAGQQSIGRLFNRKHWEGQFYTPRLVENFVKGLSENATRPIPADEVWQLTAPEFRPRPLERTDRFQIDDAYEMAKGTFELLSEFEMLNADKGEVELLATAFARLMSEEEAHSDPKVVIRETIKTISAIRQRTK